MRTDAGSRLTLIFDADDTLWQNNVYFERAIEEFLDFLNHSTLSRAEARAVLDEIERANAGPGGYGSAAFSRALTETYRRLAERDIDGADLQTVMRFGERILNQEIEVIAGVPETLAVLTERHHLILLTKGHPEEQRLKIDRSGLDAYFAHYEVVPEKDEAVYRMLISTSGLDPARSWMIGNSPRSDINPALAAGLGAVFIPHDQTWRLEHDEIGPDQDRLIVLRAFRELLDHF